MAGECYQTVKGELIPNTYTSQTISKKLEEARTVPNSLYKTLTPKPDKFPNEHRHKNL